MHLGSGGVPTPGLNSPRAAFFSAGSISLVLCGCEMFDNSNRNLCVSWLSFDRPGELATTSIFFGSSLLGDSAGWVSSVNWLEYHSGMSICSRIFIPAVLEGKKLLNYKGALFMSQKPNGVSSFATQQFSL